MLSMWCQLLVPLLFVIPTVKSLQGETDSVDWTEKHLLDKLLGNLGRLGTHARPVRNASHPVPVMFGLGLIQMELNEKENSLSLSTWTRYRWKDDFLVWDPANHDGISSIRVSHDQIWTPDIALYNTADVDSPSRDALAVVSADGTVSWFPHSIYRSSCAVDVTHYPFDIQECHLWYGSWTYNSREVDLTMAFPGGMDLSTFQADYKESSKWEVVNVTADRKLLPTPEDDPNFAVLTFKLYLRRRMVFSTYMLTLPCVFLACQTLVVFWLPPERPDRTALAMNSFASFMVLLLILVEAAMPATASVPRLGVYYCFNLVIIMFSIILSSLVVNISRGRPYRVPKWLFFITVQLLAKLICFGKIGLNMQSLEEYETRRKKLLSESQIEGGVSKRLVTSSGRSPKPDTVQISEVDPAKESLTSCPLEKCNSAMAPVVPASVECHLAEVNRTMKRLEEKLDSQQQKLKDEALVAKEWRTIGQILDRAFFYLYIILIGISLAVFFPRPIDNKEMFEN